ncbi:MAG: beta-glucosidase [Actinobacteria bacterium]|uniref:beta-glucosidase n=1 Tax=freshwater metagenome TaxID=449393 RepID=A0A6J6I3E3_9ZZZZ|nr:beta-glucosidase [Actinomycetota bacterium]
MSFPKDFLWGVATASYQVEGAVHEDGRGKTIWDTFCEKPGAIKNGDSGEIAIDHYHRFREDIAIMKAMGIKAYRFSFAWSRLFPNGDAKREERGFNFYDELVDELLAAGIEPVATLYHWDLPQPLEDAGGWPTRAVLQPFADYAFEVGKHFGNRIKFWAPLNEPWVFSWLGYGTGAHAPGRKNFDDAIRASHHTVVAHNLAYRALKRANPELQVGPVLSQTLPDVDNVFDPFQMKVAKYLDAHNNTFWMEALFRGKYPDAVNEMFGKVLSDVIEPGDLEPVKQDWIGINYYFNNRVGHEVPSNHPTRGRIFDKLLGLSFEAAPTTQLTDMGWPITPQGLGDLCLRWTAEYGDVLPPIYITENGVANDTDKSADGKIHDTARIQYLNDHLRSIRDAISAGADIRGYFQWSLFDNFEWGFGYEKRFGIVHVDYETLVRTPKDSASWYSQVIETAGQSLLDPKIEKDLLAD